MSKAEIEALFAKFVRNEGNDRAEVRDTLFKMSSSDRVKLLTSVEFVDIAVKNAAALGITNDPEDLDEDMSDYFDGDEA
jgi:hypothetical protein